MLENLFDKMKEDILVKGQNFTGRFRNTGGKYIPSVKVFDINVGVINELLKKAGLKRKLPKTVVKEVHADIRNMNRYISYQIKRLEKFRNQGNYKAYGKICIHLIRKSVSFRTSAFFRIYPSGYRSMPIGAVIGLNKEIERIIKTGDCRLIYHRVYIDKPGTDQYRPLGVPNEAGRVVMHMGSNFITMAVMPQVKEFNHGFMPGRGTGTAGVDMLRKVVDSKFVYEFDLKQFFPNVSQRKVTEVLTERYQTPQEITNGLGLINESMPKFPKVEKLDETEAKDRISKDYEILKEIGPLAVAAMKQDGFDNLGDYAKSEVFTREVIGDLPPATARGLPQGLNTSPILSLITLIDGYEQLKDMGINLLMYADDGIMYSNQNFTPYFSPLLTENKEKSRGIRKFGVGLSEIKFLGLTYNGKEDKIKGSTKNGSKLEFTPAQDNLIPLIKSLKEVFYQRPGNSVKYIAESNLMGLVQSKLYCGSGGELNQKEGEGKIHSQSGGGMRSRQKMKGHRTLSSTASKTLKEIVWGAMNRQKARHYKRTIYESFYQTP